MNEELLGTLVRDMTKAGSIPKSEARRRIGEIVSDSNQQLLERLSKKVEKKKRARPTPIECVHHSESAAWDEVCKIHNDALDEVKALIQEEIKKL